MNQYKSNIGFIIVHFMYFQNKWICAVCNDMSFEKRWLVERHVLERHSDYGWKCPECKKIFQRRSSSHGCKISDKEMLCFNNKTGSRGKEAEEEMELYKVEELIKKIKLVDTDGKEIPILNYRRRNSIEGSVRSMRTNRSEKTYNRVETKKDETEGRKRDRTAVNDNENEIQGQSQAKIPLLLDTKERKLAKIRSVLQDLSSEIGDNITICLDSEDEGKRSRAEKKIVNLDLDIHVSDTERSSLDKERKEKTSSRQRSSSSSSSGSSSSSSSSSSSDKSDRNKSGEVDKKEVDNIEIGRERTVEQISVIEEAPKLDRTVVMSTSAAQVETFLQTLQDTQENIITLNIGGLRFETSKTTLRADPSCVFALMLQPLSPFRPSKNVYFFDRDPAHFKIILNYLRNNCNVEKRYLPRESNYLHELMLEAKYYQLSGLIVAVEERLNDMCVCKMNGY
ncbi:serrate RNA effector molecule homolog [Mytilus californianus]|uniref:serrate RNA effector molecule homolog n=1 Tax=Mytilus californianus TaxID=6549 RepID=UPI0022473CD3|nr:serrate RNA effector molecule homolog [Mytilus californianus]